MPPNQTLIRTLRKLLRYGATNRAARIADRLGPDDLEAALEQMSRGERALLLEMLLAGGRGDALRLLPDALMSSSLEAVPDERLRRRLSEQPPDLVAALLEWVPEPRRQALRATLASDLEAEVDRLLRYPNDSAGAVMHQHPVSLRREATVGEAIEALEHRGGGRDVAFYAYLVDDDDHLCGVASLDELRSAAPTASLDEVARRATLSVTDLDSSARAAEVIADRGFLSLPVIDQESHLVGVVNVDDIFDALPPPHPEPQAPLPEVGMRHRAPSLHAFGRRLASLLSS